MLITPDTFILDFYLNYENTINSTCFFRETASAEYTTTLRAMSALEDATYWYCLNTDSTKYQLESLLNSYNSVNIPLVCTSPGVSTITVFCSGKNTGWSQYYTFAKTMSVVFLDALPVADYISWPSNYFETGVSVINLDYTNYERSRGVSFYGEGHTENITFSALSSDTTNYEYTWMLTLTSEPIHNATVLTGQTVNDVVTLTGTRFNTPAGVRASASIKSVKGKELYIPVELKVTIPNTLLNLQAPNYYFDDITGEKKQYSFYYSTSSDTQPNRYRENIHVKCYEPLKIKLEHKIPSPILMSDREEAIFDINLKAALRGIELDECLGLYGEVWKWSTFYRGDPVSDLPYTWSDVSSGGQFKKKWRKQSATSITNIIRSPVRHTVTKVQWSITSQYWKSNIIDNNFDYISYLPLPVVVDGQLDIPYHFDNKKDSMFTVEVTAWYDTVIPLLPNVNGVTFDWNTVSSSTTASLTGNIYTTPSVVLYPNNKYVLQTS